MSGRMDASGYPRVSVVIPTYSRAEMLERALSSIAGQTYKNIEIVIVDDNGAGTDAQVRTSERVSRFRADCDVACKYICHDVNHGGAAARNTGIEASSGSLVSFLDDDDVYFSDRIERMVPTILSNDGIGLVYSHCRAVYEDGSTFDYMQTFNGNCLFDQATFGCICATSQWLCRKDALLDVGGFDLSPAKQDSIALFKLLLAGYEIRCVPEVLSLFYEHGGIRMSNGDKALAGERQFDKLIYSNMDRFNPHERRLVKQAVNMRLAKIHFRRSESAAGARRLCAAFLNSPVKTVSDVCRQLSKHRGAFSNVSLGNE